MRRLTGPWRKACVALFVLLAIAACKRRSSAADAPAELPAELLSSLSVADPRAAAQLTHGFYALEGGSWRWTAGRFGVALAPPGGARERGARLELKLSIPAVIFERLGPMTLHASFNGEPLAPETFPAAGDFVYARDISPDLIGPDAASIEFTTSRALPPGAEDTRELALVVTHVALLPK
jgi:hypothetical protein